MDNTYNYLRICLTSNLTEKNPGKKKEYVFRKKTKTKKKKKKKKKKNNNNNNKSCNVECSISLDQMKINMYYPSNAL